MAKFKADGMTCDNETTFENWNSYAFACAINAIRNRRDTLPTHTNIAIGIVTGVFDLLHVGHINHCMQAASYKLPNNRLYIVALLNSDASVAKIKGTNRPILPLAQRLHAITQLPYVVAGAGFSEDTPNEAIAVIKPRLLFKGEDSEEDAKVLKYDVHCTELVFLPMTRGVSTSLIEQKIKKSDGNKARE